MKIQLFNTLSKTKETFKPIKEGHVGMYNCGPTVYDRAHIGNLRSYIFADTLRRTLEYSGFNVHQVMNITDVGHLVSDGDDGEDKMTKALKREGKPLTLEAMNEIATHYFKVFVEDLKSLNIELPNEFPRASEHIKEDIELVMKLQEKQIAYSLSDGIYFDTSRFLGYGKLGKIKLDAQKEGDRIAINSEKRNPADFVIWKFDKNVGWESPWGKGFPGWHIECSAMSRKYLGQPFDIHTGGIDHIPVHHNNEIAQSEAAYDQPLANYWMHNAFLNMGGEKMAKSSGGFITIDSLKEKMLSPLSYRYWLLTAHYRSPINFSYEAIQAAQNALIKLMTALSEQPTGGAVNAGYKDRFTDFINDDLDLPKALALTWDLMKDDAISAADKRATVLDFDKVFGLNLADFKATAEDDAPAEVIALAEAREIARKEKDWIKADALRKEISERGFEVKDMEGEFKITHKNQ